VCIKGLSYRQKYHVPSSVQCSIVPLHVTRNLLGYGYELLVVERYCIDLRKVKREEKKNHVGGWSLIYIHERDAKWYDA